MNEINPIANAILGSVHQQKVLGIEKNRQIRRSKDLARDVAAEDEQLDEEVETSDALVSIHDQSEQQGEQPKRRTPVPAEAKDEKPHIDIRG
jgi:hypothetical protein